MPTDHTCETTGMTKGDGVYREEKDDAAAVEKNGDAIKSHYTKLFHV